MKTLRDGRRLNLSVCSIFKNEAGNLPGLLSSLPLSQIEFIALDTGSTDVTPAILKDAGVEPRHFDWIDDFAAARNASLALATRDWILWLDGDDRLEENFWESLAPLLDGPKRAYRFIVRSPRENSHGERFRQTRLFPNHLGVIFEGRIHEQLGSSLQRLGIPDAPADLEILHTGYDTVEKRKAKLARNRGLLERERRENPEDPTVAMEYGNCLYQSGDYAAAKSVYLGFMPSADPLSAGPAPSDEVLRHFPALLGETCVLLDGEGGTQSGAADWFRLAARWNPGDIQPFYWLGKHALKAGDARAALQYFYSAVDKPALVGRVATDSHTVRRNALAMVVLCEMRLFGAGKAPRARQCLRELIEGGLKSFPLEYRVPWDFLRAGGHDAEAEQYARAYLELFPSDIAMREDLVESVLTSGRYADALKVLEGRPVASGSSGVLEAFRAKCVEKSLQEGLKAEPEADPGPAIETAYAAYRQALERFPDDPTALVYFSDFVNHNKLYARCYADLNGMARKSETVLGFLRQMETQGLGSAPKG